MMVKFFYGMSGTFKSTTINGSGGHPAVMPSGIKDWKYFEDMLFKDKIESNNLIYANLHLYNLKNFLEKNKYRELQYIERGVSDMIFYQGITDPDWIFKVINAEIKLIPEKALLRKTLLIQKDKNFIQDKVLSEPTRKEKFPDVDSYLEAQDKYVEFTKKYNTITEVIEIDDAYEYLRKYYGNSR